MLLVAAAAAALWLLILLLPWRPWSTREQLQPLKEPSTPGLPAVTVLIPARNEAETIALTVRALVGQAGVARILVVDDQSSDDTAARAASIPGVEVMAGQATPPGWSGKLWAQQQGLERIDTPLVLLTDGDIEFAPGMVAALVEKLDREHLDLVSIMATLPTGHWPEKLMLPAFVYFFRQLYPFAWVNRDDRPGAAAAGGCVLVRRELLTRIDAFGAWKHCLIDDCELARRARRAGGRLWLGLSHGVQSLRRHPDLDSVLETIRRTAFEQLQRSVLLVTATALLMVLMFVAPWLGLLAGLLQANVGLFGLGLAGLGLMGLGYWPQLRFHGLHPLWALSFSAAGLLFLLATLQSAWQERRGEGAGWKGRRYGSTPSSPKTDRQ
ncbi:MAG: glycosyltransferase [Wenzhouxiangellaceae bacterium]|nr:glycosyltransferase [Wenzhouxiangellaceae bacterium]